MLSFSLLQFSHSKPLFFFGSYRDLKTALLGFLSVIDELFLDSLQKVTDKGSVVEHKFALQ